MDSRGRPPHSCSSRVAIRTLNKNKDGKLTRDELLPGFHEGGPAGPDPAELLARMMAFDRNGDRMLSKDQLPERMRGLLERADANKDGFVDKDELTRLVQQQSGRCQGRGPGTGHGGFLPRDGGRGPGKEPDRWPPRLTCSPSRRAWA